MKSAPRCSLSLSKDGRELRVHIPIRRIPKIFEQRGTDILDISKLTPAQVPVCALLRKRKSNKEISSILNLGERTVKFHVSSIYQVLGVTRFELMTIFAES